MSKINGTAAWASLIAAMLMMATGASAENWPRFGGADGSFHSGEGGVPVTWDAGDLAWSAELPGRGQSSPVIWGDRVYLTSASKDGRERMVLCLHRADGRVLWTEKVPTTSQEDLHRMNTYATASCATDGERVLAFFGPAGLHCYDAMTGKKQWSRDLGTFPFQWGTAASPIILGDMVFQNCDAIGPSYLIALDKKTGETIWKTDRADKPKGGWSTPILIDAGSRQELVLNGEYGVRGYDPKTGKKVKDGRPAEDKPADDDKPDDDKPSDDKPQTRPDENEGRTNGSSSSSSSSSTAPERG